MILTKSTKDLYEDYSSRMKKIADVKAAAAASVPLGRLGTPDDLGKAAVFLASDDSAYVSGIELFVDGGVAQI